MHHLGLCAGNYYSTFPCWLSPVSVHQRALAPVLRIDVINKELPFGRGYEEPRKLLDSEKVELKSEQDREVCYQEELGGKF